MTPPADRPIPYADFNTPERIVARDPVVRALRAESSVYYAERLINAWVNYDNLLYDTGRAASVPAHEDTDFLLDVWCEFATWCGPIGERWYSDRAPSVLERVAATLLERGVLEKHPTMDWYRRATIRGGA